MKVTVRCFASVRELLGGEDVLALDVPEGTTVESLKALLAERAPDLARLRLAVSVNRDYSEPDRALQAGDEVAFIPPISGGSGRNETDEAADADGSDPDAAACRALFRFDLTQDELDPRQLEREVRTDADGAVVTFSGVTRNHNEGRAVEGLSYEAYEEMASKVMGALFEETLKTFAVSRARVAHRLGEVPIGQASVVVVVSAEHRGAAFDACRFLMDRVKAEVPIFKRERLADGGEHWVGELPRGRPRA